MTNRAVLDNKGLQFETEIALLLHKYYPNAVVLNNMWAYSEFMERATQVDITMITEKGLYFIEAKNWRTCVYGNVADSKWRGKASGCKMLEVPSILKQNIIHIRAVRNGLRRRNVEPVRGQNIIVFPVSTRIFSDANEIVNINNLISRIDAIEVASTDSVNVKMYADAITNLSNYAKYREMESKKK